MAGRTTARSRSPRRPDQPRRPNQVEEGHRTTAFELFFDLVFVFAMTRITALMAGDPTPQGLVRGLLALGVLWWCWCAFTWLGATVRLDVGLERGGMFVVVAVMFVVALTIPEAYTDLPGGLPGPIVFVCCYLAVRVLHVGLFWYVSAGDAGLRRQLVVNLVPLAGGAALLFVAAFAHGWLQTGLWAAALAWDLGFVLGLGVTGWRVYAASHFSERYGLVVIIALGESLASIGVGASRLPVSWSIVAAAVLGATVAGALWWAYFDTVAIAAEEALTRARGSLRVTLAAHGYTYLHLPLVAGIVLTAFGMEEVLVHLAGHAEPLRGTPFVALYGGVLAYLVGHLLFARRMFGTWKVVRLIGALAIIAGGFVGWFLPALGALALLTAILAATLAVETLQYAENRAAIRSAAR